LFGGTVGKDTVSRTWRKVKSDWDAWHTRSLRLILDGTVVRVRLDRKATSISLLVVLGVRNPGRRRAVCPNRVGTMAPVSEDRAGRNGSTGRIRAGRAARYPQPAQEVALSNQYRVCSSVQPGTAKRAGAVTPWLGRTMTCWRVRKCTVGGLERCTVAASAEAHRVINRPKAKAERIAMLSNRATAVLRGSPA
jgi:hypothetical protein